MTDDLLGRIDDWSDAVDTGHELVGRDLLYETWALVEQVRKERDAAVHDAARIPELEAENAALRKLADALAGPLAEMVNLEHRPAVKRAMSLYSDLLAPKPALVVPITAEMAEDIARGLSSPVPGTPTPTGQT